MHVSVSSWPASLMQQVCLLPGPVLAVPLVCARYMCQCCYGIHRLPDDFDVCMCLHTFAVASLCTTADVRFHGMYAACAQACQVPAEFVKQPIACLTLASFLATNTGDVARKHIQDPELLSFIDIECYCWSTVLAGLTPMMNAGMVFCDRHYGGINYPKGGVGRIAQALAGRGLLLHLLLSCRVV